jgi:mannose-6-phosphate isomerase-like protein (cupin superfamily)
VLRRPDAAHDLLTSTGWADYLATGATTGGDFGLYRWHMSGPRTGPDPHFHRTLSESFFVISGTVRLHDGSAWIDGRPGDFLYVPPGGIHGFRNESGEPAEMLILFTPGAPRERYFEGLVEVAQLDPRPDQQAMAEFFLEHDTFWVE